MNGVPLGRTTVVYNRFDSDTLMDAGSVEGAILLIMGVGSPAVFDVDGESVVTTEKGAIISPSRMVAIDRPAGSGTFIIRAGFEAIEERFCEVMDRRPGKPLVFDRSVDLAKDVGAQAQHLVNDLANTFQHDSTIVENPLLRAGFDDMLLNLLLAMPNNYSDELSGGRRLSIAPALVRRAEEYLEANAAEAVTISDLVALCNCSRRALFNAFRKFRDYTPMQFLADSRLKSAHEVLQTPTSGDTVTSIAYASGFSHLGRFSEAYRHRFGELPSKTLRRAAPTTGA